MSTDKDIIVRLTPYTEDAFGPPPPPVVHGPPRLWTLLAAIIVALPLAQLLSMLCLVAVCLPVLSQLRAMRVGLRAMQTTLTQQPAGYFAAGLGVCTTLAMVALVAAVFSPTTALRERLRIVERPWWFLHGLLAALATIGVGEVVTGARAFAGVNGGGPLGVMQRDFGSMGVELTFLGVVVVAFGAGIGEELFFRGYLQTRLEARIPHWAANLMVGILFGVAHGELWHSTFALGAGLIFGFVARRTGTILASMTAHVINNAARVVQSSLAAGATASWYHDRGLSSGAIGLSLIGVGLGGIVVLTRHREPSNT